MLSTPTAVVTYFNIMQENGFKLISISPHIQLDFYDYYSLTFNGPNSMWRKTFKMFIDKT